MGGGRYFPDRGLHLEASVNILLLCWFYTCNSTQHKWWLWFVLWLLNGCFHLILTSAAVIIVTSLVRSWTSEPCPSLIIQPQLYKQKKWGRKGWAHEAHLCRQLTAYALIYVVTLNVGGNITGGTWFLISCIVGFMVLLVNSSLQLFTSSIFQIFVYFKFPFPVQEKPRHFSEKSGVNWGPRSRSLFWVSPPVNSKSSNSSKKCLSSESSEIIRTQLAGKGWTDVTLDQRYQKGPMKKAGRFDSPAWCACGARANRNSSGDKKDADSKQDWYAEDWPFYAIGLLWSQILGE